MRNTDLDWIRYGESEPYYAVLTHERFLRANLTDEALAEFWQSGRSDISWVWRHLVGTFGERPVHRALDFGCGVGRLTRAIAEIADQAVGVDVSPSMVAEARAHASANMEFTTELPDGPFDWMNSFIVLQHIPPQRGYELVERLLAGAAESCVLSLHFTLFKDARGLTDHGLDAMRFGTWDGDVIRPLLRREAEHKMMMYDYDLTRLFAMLVDRRFTDVRLLHTDHAGAHGAMVLAAR